jgi:hypothetical protein
MILQGTFSKYLKNTPYILCVALPMGPSFLPVAAPFEKKRIGVAYHQKKQPGSGRPPANSHTQNSINQQVKKMVYLKIEF